MFFVFANYGTVIGVIVAYRLIVFAERFACLDFLERVAIPGEG